MTQIDIAALVADLTTKSAMINMGEKIAWGSETTLMDQAVAALIAQDAELKRYRDLLAEARGDLEAYVDADYPENFRAKYPDIARRYSRDMELCRRIDEEFARAALGYLP